MIGRGIDQILPYPSNPVLHEPDVQSALEYVSMAERLNGPIPKPVDFSYVWGDALEELNRVGPAARIVNLETSITTSENFEPKGINYRMHPSNTPCLSAAKIDCCVLANNHVLDWGRSGLVETIDTLGRARIKSAGAGHNVAEAMRPAAIKTDGDSRVLVIAVGMADSGIDRGCAATESRPGVVLLPDLSDGTATRIAKEVRGTKRPGDIAVLSIHWGRNWGYEISRQQQAFARKLINLAAIDVVHGHSSHHPKGIEIYKDKPIFYGCGDFLNDYEGIAGYEEFRTHLVLAYFLAVDPGTGMLLRLEMAPFETKRFRLHRASDSDARWLRDTLNRQGDQLGTRVVLTGEGQLSVQW